MSLAGTLGRDREIASVAGKEYTLTPPQLAAVLHAESELRRVLPGPLRRAAAVAGLIPPAAAAEFWKQAWAEEAAWREAQTKQAEANPGGSVDALQAQASLEQQLGFAALLLLHRHHGKEFNSIEAAIAWVNELGAERFQQISLALMPPPPTEKKTEPSPTGPS